MVATATWEPNQAGRLTGVARTGSARPPVSPERRLCTAKMAKIPMVRAMKRHDRQVPVDDVFGAADEVDERIGQVIDLAVT